MSQADTQNISLLSYEFSGISHQSIHLRISHIIYIPWSWSDKDNIGNIIHGIKLGSFYNTHFHPHLSHHACKHSSKIIFIIKNCNSFSSQWFTCFSFSLFQKMKLREMFITLLEFCYNFWIIEYLLNIWWSLRCS